MKLAHSLILTSLPRLSWKIQFFVSHPRFTVTDFTYKKKPTALLYMNLVLRAHVDSSVISVLFTDWLTVVSARAIYTNSTTVSLKPLHIIASLISTWAGELDLQTHCKQGPSVPQEWPNRSCEHQVCHNSSANLHELVLTFSVLSIKVVQCSCAVSWWVQWSDHYITATCYIV